MVFTQANVNKANADHRERLFLHNLLDFSEPIGGCMKSIPETREPDGTAECSL